MLLVYAYCEKKFSDRKGQDLDLAVQWLRLHASTSGCTDLIPGQGTKKKNKIKITQNPTIQQ